MISFAGLFIAILFMLFFGWLFCSAYAMGMKGCPKPDTRSIVVFCIYAFAGAILLYILMMQRHTVNVSDWWVRSYDNMLMLFSRPFLAILRLGGTVLFGEYNTLPCMIIAFPLKLFGYSFVRYVLVTYVFFYLPVCFIIFSILRKVLRVDCNHLFLLLIFLFTPIQIVKTAGFVDVACMIPAGLALLLVDDYDATIFDRNQIKRDVYISVLLLLSMLFRRYFACFIVGYMSALALLSLYQVKQGTKPKSKMLKNAFLNIAVIGFTALVIMVVFMSPLLFRILKNRYGVIYEAYAFTWSEKLYTLADTYGLLVPVLAFAGLVLSLFRKRFMKYACFCTISALATIYSFFTVQGGFGTFHVYIYMMQLFILSAIFIVHIIELLKNKSALKTFAVSIIYVLIFAADFVNCYVPPARTLLSGISFMFNEEYKPEVRNDLDQLYALAEYANSLTEGSNRSVYVLGGSALSEFTMEYLYKPQRSQGLNNQIKGRGDEIIDGFPVNFLAADIIITSYAESDDYGTVRRVLAREMNDSSSLIGRHFIRKDRRFELDGNAEAFVFEKQEEFTGDDLRQLAEYFTELYPGREELYAKRILVRQNQWDIQGQRNRGLAVKGIKWLLEKKILTPEELAAVTDRSVDEINLLAGN